MAALNTFDARLYDFVNELFDMRMACDLADGNPFCKGDGLLKVLKREQTRNASIAEMQRTAREQHERGVVPDVLPMLANRRVAPTK